MAEVVHVHDAEPVELRPCPDWCVQAEHFDEGTVAHADDGYHHHGPEIAVRTSDRMVLNDPETVVWVILKAWTHPLDADPGPARIELNLGTAEVRTDSSAELTPSEARAVARALLQLADTADGGATGEGLLAAGREGATASVEGRLAALETEVAAQRESLSFVSDLNRKIDGQQELISEFIRELRAHGQMLARMRVRLERFGITMSDPDT